MKSTRAPSSSQGVQWGLSKMPDAATQAHRGLRSQGSDHNSKSRRAGTEKREASRGETSSLARSDSTRKGTHHIVKRPDQAGIRGPARGPSHPHPTRGDPVNPATTRSYVEVVRGVVPRSGRPTTASGPPHSTRYILLPRAPTHTPQRPSARGAPALPRSSTHHTQCAAQHPPWRGAARCYPTKDNTRNNPHSRAPWDATRAAKA